jgi:hypothetical protein
VTFPLTTTLNRIHACNPCPSGMLHGLQAAGKTAPDDAPILFSDIASAMSLADAMWCCRAEPQHAAIWRRYAVWCARQVQHLLADPRSLAALAEAAEATAWDTRADWAAAEAADWAVRAARDAADAATKTAQRQAFIQICTDGTLPGEVES